MMQVMGKPTEIRYAAIYIRVSTGEQGESWLGMEAQEAKCRELCARKGWQVLNVYRDAGFSGRLPVDRRPGLMAAIAATEIGPDRILVANDLSRLARNVLMALSILDESFGRGIPFASASQADLDTSTPIGRAVLTVVGAFAQLEAEDTGKRTRAALKAAKDRGVKLGALSLIESYRPTGRLNSRQRMTFERFVDPQKVETIRTVQSMARTAASMEELTRSLNEVGIPSVTGKRWHPRIVKKAVDLVLP